MRASKAVQPLTQPLPLAGERSMNERRKSFCHWRPEQRFGTHTAVDGRPWPSRRCSSRCWPVGLRQDHDPADDRGLVEPSGGAIRSKARSFSHQARQARARIVFQSYALFPHCRWRRTWRRAEMRRRAGERTRRVGETLTGRPRPFTGRFPRQLSGGHSSAWRWPRSRDPASDPVLDEPLSNLTPSCAREQIDCARSSARSARPPSW